MKISYRIPRRFALLGLLALLAGWHGESSAGNLTNGLLCHLTFDNNYNDDSGNALNGTPVGTPTFVPGKIGSGAVSVTTLKDGSEIDYVTLGYPSLLQFDTTENFSVSFWTSYTNQVDDPPFISNKNWSSSGNVGWGIFTQNGGNFRVNVRGDGGGSTESTTHTPPIRDGNWHHLVVTFDRSSVVSIYVDGQLYSTDPLTATPGNIDTFSQSYNVNIGQDGTGNYTDGGNAQMVGVMIDDLGIWGRVLSASEVSAIYQGGLVGSNIVQVVTKLPPVVSALAPAPGFTGAAGFPTISVSLVDQDTAVVPSTVKLTLDGSQVPATVTKTTNLTTVVYAVTNLLAAGSTHTASLSFSDNNTPPSQLGTNWTFTVLTYPTIPASFAQPPGAVSTNSPGFVARVSQYDYAVIMQNDGTSVGTLPGCTARAEAQLAGVLSDPMTGQPYAETVTPGPLANGAYSVSGVLNFSFDGSDQGNFTSGNGYLKSTPPGVALPYDHNLAVEFTGYLSLPAGYYRFGVNSADGFRMTIGTNAYDAFSTQVGIYDTRRIPGDTTFDLYVAQSGFYACKVVWFRQSPLPDNRGIAGLELYTITPAGQKVLVNDTTNPQAVMAYPTSTAPVAPYVQYAGPTSFISDYRGNDFGSPSVQVQIHDGSSGTVDPSSVKLSIDGALVPATVTNRSGITSVTYTPGGLQLPRTVHTGQISFTAGGATTTKTWQFNHLRNYVLSTPVYSENFDEVADGGLPAGWSQTNYTTSLEPGNMSFTDPNSDAYLGWTVVSTNDVGTFSPNRLYVGLYQELNGRFFDAVTNPLMQGQFLYAESDHRSGQQIQFLYTTNYNLSGKTGIVVAFDSSYEQNQNNICSLEYSVDHGTNWLPLLYLLQGDNDDQQTAEIARDPNGIVDVAKTMAFSINPRYTNALGKVIGGSLGAFIGAPISQALEPYIEGRVNDDTYESMRFEALRVPNADNQTNVQFRLMQAGTGSWFWGLDNWGIYSVPALATQSPGPLTIRLQGTAIVLSWPADPNVQLQTSPSVSPTSWQNVPGTLGSGSVTNSASGSAAFYRLIRQ